jgi:hypothetical protein
LLLRAIYYRQEKESQPQLKCTCGSSGSEEEVNKSRPELAKAGEIC